MYLGVKSVTASDQYRLILVFENGETRCFDMRPLLATGRFRELTTPELFKTARVAFDTVEWENGPDLDPEYLYDRSEPLSREEPTSAEVRSV